MGQTNYTINEYGEINRGDYFFTSVKGSSAQMLPTNRKVFVIWLLSFITFGIYGFIVMFAMAKETNIACVEDDKHTRQFWGTVLLSIITLGIYGIVWYYKWADREYNYLGKHTKEGGILSGGALVFLMIITLILNVVLNYVMPSYGIEAYWTAYFVVLIWNIIVMSRYVKQHNMVCKVFNINTFGQKA